MRTIADIEADIEAPLCAPPGDEAERLLSFGEEILALWLIAHGQAPTGETSEGFRLLALHRQGARGDASFNACRETCRELAYRYNLMREPEEWARAPETLEAMRSLARHLALFIGGKLENARLGEFCCSSRPLRVESPGIQES